MEPEGRSGLRRSQVDEILIEEYEEEEEHVTSASESSGGAVQSLSTEEDHSGWDDLAETLADEDHRASWRGQHLRFQDLGRNFPPKFRSPDISVYHKYRVVCVMGHVDTGKTTLLDKLRKSSVQAEEAGGITQQMGATFFPREILIEKTSSVNLKNLNMSIHLPGLLILDTPGHASFGAMRSRGVALCDIAIVVIDIMHGIENTTKESIELLIKHKVPFVIALNKCDRLYGWKSVPDAPIMVQLKNMETITRDEFETRVEAITNELKALRVPTALYYSSPDFKKYVSMVPISAVTGEGICDLLFLLILLSQKFLSEKLKPTKELQCTVLEVRDSPGLGVCLNVVLINGTLRAGNTFVAAGLDGPIVSRIRTLIVPPTLQEIRDTSKKVSYSGYAKRASGTIALKIVGKDLSKIVPGSPLICPTARQNIEVVKAMVMSDINNIMNMVMPGDYGVVVKASTLGSLEALVEFLALSGITIRSVGLGKVGTTDIYRAANTTHKRWKCILAFDVTIDKRTLKMARDYDVVVIGANIIYNLLDQWRTYASQESIHITKKLPFILRPLTDAPVHSSPLSFSVDVVGGAVEVDCELFSSRLYSLGNVTSIQRFEDGVLVNRARTGDRVTITTGKIQTFDPWAETIIPGCFQLTKDCEYDRYGHLQSSTPRWKVQVPPEWSRLQDPFLKDLYIFVERMCLEKTREQLVALEEAQREQDAEHQRVRDQYAR